MGISKLNAALLFFNVMFAGVLIACVSIFADTQSEANLYKKIYTERRERLREMEAHTKALGENPQAAKTAIRYYNTIAPLLNRKSEFSDDTIIQGAERVHADCIEEWTLAKLKHQTGEQDIQKNLLPAVRDLLRQQAAMLNSTPRRHKQALERIERGSLTVDELIECCRIASTPLAPTTTSKVELELRRE